MEILGGWGVHLDPTALLEEPPGEIERVVTETESGGRWEVGTRQQLEETPGFPSSSL